MFADYRVELVYSLDLQDGEILEFVPKDARKATSRQRITVNYDDGRTFVREAILFDRKREKSMTPPSLPPDIT